MPKLDLHSLARLGAAVRIKELEAEIASIRKAFPTSGSKREIPVPRKKAVRRRKRSHMSAAARKAVSIRMKKYWAARRKGKGSKT